MARKAVRPIEPEEPIQDAHDDEPARELEDDGGDSSGVNKTALIREAVAAGHAKPAHGVAYIREQHGVEVDPKYFSIVKGKLGKDGLAPASSTPAAEPRKSAPSAPSGAVPASLFDDLKQLRDLKDRYGDDLRKMVEAIG